MNTKSMGFINFHTHKLLEQLQPMIVEKRLSLVVDLRVSEIFLAKSVEYSSSIFMTKCQ